MTAFALRPEHQALLVVDMQNDFLRVGAPQEVAAGRDVIPTIADLVERFRAASRPVLFTRFLAGPERTLMWTWSPECGPEQRSCWPGETRTYGDREQELYGADVVDELTPQPGEVIVDKYGYGAFHHTILADALTARGISQVVTCGVITQICVEDTVRQGFHHGYEMVVVEDAVASFDDELHRSALRSLGMKYAVVLDSDAVVRAMDSTETTDTTPPQ